METVSSKALRGEDGGDAQTALLQMLAAKASTPRLRLLAKAKIDKELGNGFIWHAAVDDVLALCEQHKALESALSELYELVDSDASFENRDIEPYKYDAIIDDTLRQARAALAKVSA